MTQATRDKAFRKAQAARGLVKVTVWVPAGQADAIKQTAASLRRYLAPSTFQGLPPPGSWRE